MAKRYLIREGYTLHDLSGNVMGSGGDVVELDTDSEDYDKRTYAESILRGKLYQLIELGPEEAPKPKPTKGYKTRQAKAEKLADPEE